MMIESVRIEPCSPLGKPFVMLESRDADGVLRLRLVGELDLAVAGGLLACLEQRIGAGERTRLDLSRLDFIDSSGIRALISVVEAGRCDGRELVEVDRWLGDQVQRVVDLVGAALFLWPVDGGADGRELD